MLIGHNFTQLNSNCTRSMKQGKASVTLSRGGVTHISRGNAARNPILGW
jgi:hypothetical protein